MVNFLVTSVADDLPPSVSLKRASYESTKFWRTPSPLFDRPSSVHDTRLDEVVAFVLPPCSQPQYFLQISTASCGQGRKNTLVAYTGHIGLKYLFYLKIEKNAIAANNYNTLPSI